MGGIADLESTANGGEPENFPHPIAFNVLPHIGDFSKGGYTGEEEKLIAEIKKILKQPELAITATCVRVPVKIGHSLSINVTLSKAFKDEYLQMVYFNKPGVVLEDEPENNIYPMPIKAAGNDNVYVGRLRRDLSFKNSINMWVCADNTRKGAATNAIQILEKLAKGNH